MDPIRDDVLALGRRVDKLNNKRKLDRDELREVRDRLDVVMTFLDGMYNGNRRFGKVGLKPVDAEVDESA